MISEASCCQAWKNDVLWKICVTAADLKLTEPWERGASSSQGERTLRNSLSTSWLQSVRHSVLTWDFFWLSECSKEARSVYWALRVKERLLTHPVYLVPRVALLLRVTRLSERCDKGLLISQGERTTENSVPILFLQPLRHSVPPGDFRLLNSVGQVYKAGSWISLSLSLSHIHLSFSSLTHCRKFGAQRPQCRGRRGSSAWKKTHELSFTAFLT